MAWGKGRVPVGINTSDSDFNTIEKTGGVKVYTTDHQHNLPIGIDTNVGNWSYLQWNNEFGYGYNEFTSPNHNAINNTPLGSSRKLYQLRSNIVSLDTTTLQPYIVCYMWKRTA